MKELLLKVSEILMLRQDLLSRTLSLNLMELGNFPKIVSTLPGTSFISVYILRTFWLQSNMFAWLDLVLQQLDLLGHERDCFQTKGRLPMDTLDWDMCFPLKWKSRAGGRIYRCPFNCWFAGFRPTVVSFPPEGRGSRQIFNKTYSF